MMALLIDPDGYVLSLSGNKQTLKRAKHINFIEGVKWTEAAVGTNAIGTALEIEEAIMISGTEHYPWHLIAGVVRLLPFITMTGN